MEYKIQTPHYSFILRVEEYDDSIPKHKLFVGDEKGPCLEATVFMASAVLFEPHICILHQIDALEECAQQDVEDDSASLGLELFYAFISIITTNYSHITHISLRDASYIPCNRRLNDTLDLLSYDIALYGKTWYEMHAGAHLPSISKQERYEKEIYTFMNPESKTDTTFSNLLKYIIKHNDYAFRIIQPNIESYERIYNDSKTFSDFFRILKKDVNRHNVCRFFKGWLELFVQDWVRIERDWLIPIHTNVTLEQKGVLNITKKRPIPRRRSRKSFRKA
jgi:hypothetical protein